MYNREMRQNFARVSLLTVYLLVLLLGVFAYNSLFDALQGRGESVRTGISGSGCEARTVWRGSSSKAFGIATPDGKRTYYIHLPQGYESYRRYPVILAFTGKNMKISFLEKVSGLNALPAIVVYPQAMRGTAGAYSWQGAPYSPKVNDVRFVGQVLDQVQQKLCVDTARIYSVGISNGGGMSWLLSCKLSHRIAAFAMLSGAYYFPDKQCTPDRPAPLLNIHGGKDSVIPYGGSKRKKLPAITTWVRARAAYNGCHDKQPTVTRPSRTTKITTWRNCPYNATVQNVELTQARHDWPTSVTVPSDDDERIIQLGNSRQSVSTAVPTAFYIWYFLEQHPFSTEAMREFSKHRP